jgi:prepilin signal peptidase PulO-like enzyme (type II secretory pathway)
MIDLILFKVIAVFTLGLIFGSFANVVVDRGETEENLSGRSRCDKCKKKLGWYDNIPLLSYLLLRGKCRQCQKKISWQYPAVELLFGLGFVFISWRTNFILGFLDKAEVIDTTFYLVIGFVLLTILVWDLKHMIIPDGLVVGGLVLAGIYFGYQYLISPYFLMSINTDLTRNILGGILTSGFFYLMFRFSNGRWIGGGDVKLGALVGFLVGWKMIYFLLMIAYILGAIPAIYLLITKKATVKTRIPFGPFLVIAVLVTMLFEKEILIFWEKFVLN